MTYSSGNTILAADYNTFVGTVNTVIGPSASLQSGSGYNQSTLNTVAASATVGASEWGTLITAVKSAATHQGTTVDLPAANPSTGDLIEALEWLAKSDEDRHIIGALACLLGVTVSPALRCIAHN